jgi:16S rRNA (cytosine967-C5)-methyltransferase
VDRSEAAAVAHPRWLLREIRSIAGDLAADVIAANNESPPMTLRVNALRTTRDAQLQAMRDAGIEADAGALPTSIVLADAVDVERLPGFAAGSVSVQDAGAQHAAVLLAARRGEHVLDACAAPGGKTGHLLEHTPELGGLVALDVSRDRLARVASNLERLGLHATLIADDLLAGNWWNGRPFDRILLDAPCSATGVIRRHPDIKLLRRPEDIAGFAATQRAMLAKCATMLVPGGTLLYATCSMLRAENQQVVEQFLGEHPGWSRAREDLQVLPASRARGPRAVTDGFYYASLKKGTLEASTPSGSTP